MDQAAINIFGVSVSIWLAVPVVYLIWVSVLLALKRILFAYLHRFSKKTQFTLDDVLFQSLDFPVTLLVFASGGFVVERMLAMTRQTEIITWVVMGFKAATIVAVILFLDRFINEALKRYAYKVEVIRVTGGILRGTVRAIVIGLGVLILLDSFGVSITPLLASLGVGSLAVALALQPTLESFFAGVQIVVDKPFLVGHFIKLESGEEGYVERIGWRSTWIRMLPNNMVVMPNKNLINSKIINYYYPQTEMAVLVQVGVHYNSDLKHVEKVTCEVAKEILNEVPGGVKDFEPFIRYHTFDSSSINFTVILRAKEFVDQYLIKHEFIKRLHERYRKEGIVIPFPIRAINLEQEGADQLVRSKEGS